MRGRGAGSGGRVAPSEGARPAPESQVPPADRRRLRGSRTRAVILEALVALLEAGNPQPSSREIAEHAGVARRSVFHHFGDVDELYLAAVELQAARRRALIAPVAPVGDLDDRIRGICRQRRDLFEPLGPVLRAASARFEDSAAFDAHLVDLRLLLRDQLEATFAPELGARRTGAGVLLDTVEMATGWAHWQALRFEAHHPADTAEALMAYAVVRLLR